MLEPISADSARRQARADEDAEHRYQAVREDAPEAGKFGIHRWLKAHPQAIGEYRHADNTAGARLLADYLLHRKALDPNDWDVAAGFFIDEILSAARGADPDSLARRLVQLWKWSEA